MARHLIRELAWAAGFFEGEGCVSIKKEPSRNDGFSAWYLKLSIGLTEEIQVRKFQSMFGGGLHVRASDRGYKDVWYWSVSCEDACAAIEAMQPYFIGQTKWDRYEEAMGEIFDHYANEPELSASARGSGHSRSWMGVS